MDADDLQVGHQLTRREALALMGATGVMLFTGCSSTSTAKARPVGCVVRPQQTEGPYYVNEMLNRSDIRSDPSDGAVRPGIPLQVSFNVSRMAPDGCTPFPGAYVDVWHCDHAGVYSDVEDPGFNSVGKKFLRGYQVTDKDGIARFTTIYPGWYSGRAVHIHFKIRSAPSISPGFEFTSQVYFDDALTDRVHALEPYAARGPRDVRNPEDRIFRQGGSQLLLALTPDAQGYSGAFDITLQAA
jgi:protocatechuate 3,4-dioxygenase beta subunit